ncbi:NAD-dependent epimerase/dehydratase family protein [Kitasatospora sp. NPDC008050]|uniref:NAD-dependent epimerase/dehydratase family protein n=1 Tax=Kitasatospora sp. NPDC008050 TaxID=3364021 RepID=UPI0036ED3C23
MARTDDGAAAGLSVVVLGGTGYLGPHISAAFGATGARVHLVSRSAAQDPAADVRSLRLDLLAARPQEIAGLLGSLRADVVVNAAGRVWRADEAEMAAGNGELVRRVTDALAALPRPARLIQLGTIHEYGAGTPGFGTTEDQPPAPVTPYGRTKLLGTEAALRAAQDQGVDVVVLRLANAIGAGAPRGSLFGMVAAHLGEAALAHARGERPAELRLPPLRARRDVVDVRDAVDAIVAAATAPGADVPGQVINIGRGEAVPMGGLIERMITLSGLEVPVVDIGDQAPARADVEWQQMDVSRARKLLGWQPRRTLDASLLHLLEAATPPLDRRN